MFWNKDNKSDIELLQSKYNKQLQLAEEQAQQWYNLEQLLLLAIENISKLAIGHDKGLDSKLSKLCQAIRDKSFNQDAYNDISDLVEYLQQLNKPKQANGNNELADSPTVQTILLSLLEHLDIPAEFETRADFLKEQLLHSYQDKHAPKILKSLADLVADIHDSAHKEKEELEEFLHQLTGKLKEIDTLIQDTASETKASAKDGELLDKNLSTQVEDIETGVRNASDMDQLQSFVFARLEKIRRHMQEYKESEAKRHHNLESQLGKLQTQLNNMESETASLRSNLLKKQIQATRDPLTGVYNRLAFDERVELEYERHYRYEQPLSLLIWDIDYFKKINDTFGHQAGDKVLISLANNFQQRIRKTDFFARYGGEEFVLLMPETNIKTAHKVAEKLRESVEELVFHYKEKPVKISISCGIAEFHTDDTPSTVINRADAALYRAKNSGRNRCELEKI